MTGRQALYAITLTICVILQPPNPQALLVPQARIVGGKDATANSAPFIVSIQQELSTGNAHYCAGTIINANWVLTAAHCLQSHSVLSSSIMIAGSLSISGSGSTTQKRKIDYYVSHDLYTGGIAPYDIGLIYTRSSFQWTTAVKPATLPKANAIPTGTATVFGWGSISTSTTAKYPTNLQVANSIPILKTIQCESALGASALNLHDTNICTGPLNGGIGICTSDSGGPLMQSNTLIGIISWGRIPCGQANSPSIYVRVSAFNSWISQHQIAPK